MTMLGAGVVIVAIAFSAVGLLWVLPAYRTFRSRRTVVCPKTNQPAAIQVDAGRAARSAWMGPLELHLRNCSEWPKESGCAEGCLDQLPVR